MYPVTYRSSVLLFSMWFSTRRAPSAMSSIDVDHIENNSTEDRYVTGYIRAVRQYALNAQRGDGMGVSRKGRQRRR
jgi:hypothetical protein